jgi:hypothetical protein
LGCRLTVHRQTESSSCSYGLVVRLLLLPTPPCGDAVALGYGPESVCPEGTFTPLTIAPFGRTSHQRSWWIVHTQPTKTAAAGLPESRHLHIGMREVSRTLRLSMNDPPTALVGFQESPAAECRLSMNDPPTALVGFGRPSKSGGPRLHVALIVSSFAREAPRRSRSN